jgi:hypothetical protein|tara:strand:+ start:23431 stop:24168 length:738 start_codon:yes stop_codon:yes gene_type:complete
MSDDQSSTAKNSTLDSTRWGVAASYHKVMRDMRTVNEIVIKGAIEVVFFVSKTPQLVVASDNPEAVDSVHTRFVENKLVIEREGMSFSIGRGNVVVTGNGRIAAGGDIYVNGDRITPSKTGAEGSCMVAVVLPDAPDFQISGSGEATLYSVKQDSLALTVSGSGGLTVYGQVQRLSAEISGSGDVDCSDLSAESARLQISGSGTVSALVTKDVDATVSGSGSITVRGGPEQRKERTSGSGRIRFK